MNIIAPIVHLNGTSADSLIHDRREVFHELCDVLDALQRMSPNGRDYYLTPGLFEKATEQHNRRVAAIGALKKEIIAECDLIDQQR